MAWPHASFLGLSVSSSVKWANDAAFGEDEMRQTGIVTGTLVRLHKWQLVLHITVIMGVTIAKGGEQVS